jgi:MFS family permease
VVMGSIIQGISSIHHSLMQFLVGGFFVGFGVNVSISCAPLYVVEISHSQYRGVMTGLHNCTWFIGSISASAVTRGSNSYRKYNVVNSCAGADLLPGDCLP